MGGYCATYKRGRGNETRDRRIVNPVGDGSGRKLHMGIKIDKSETEEAVFIQITSVVNFKMVYIM